MARKKSTTRGPTLFAEWVVGGPIIPLRAAKKKKETVSKQQVISVELTTDDESETDTLRITYPRSSRGPNKDSNEDAEAAATKKVRFEETNLKSSLKNGNTNNATSESETGADTDADTDVESTGSSNAETSESEGSSNSEPSKKEKSKKDTSEPHLTCNCSKCTKQVRKRAKKSKKYATKCDESSSEGESSTSAKDRSGKRKKEKKKKDKKPAEKDTSGDNSETTDTSDAQTSANTTSSTDDDEAVKEDEKGKKARKGKPVEEKTVESKSREGEEENQVREKIMEKPTAGNARDYPDPIPFGGQPRLPHLIAPICAKVVQTESVIETPEDPRPNAFYDPKYNIMRVYHGPVYGNHDFRSLYPLRDPNYVPMAMPMAMPAPMGIPNPTQNPYFNDSNNVTKLFGPMGYPPPTQQAPPNPTKEDMVETASNRGAFSKTNGSNQNDDASGKNNIVPEAATPTRTNPYYSPRRDKSLFSGMRSNRTSSNASQRNDAANTNTWGDPGDDKKHQDGPQNQNNDTPNWATQDNGNGNGNTQDSWDNKANSNNNNNTNTNNDSGTIGWGNNDTGSNSNNNAQTTPGQDAPSWDNNPETQTSGGDSGQANTSNSNDNNNWNEPSSMQENNIGIMPGGWQDASMAASTNGLINKW